MPATSSRLVDGSIHTVTKHLVDVGSGSGGYQDGTLRDLPWKRIPCDEIGSFCDAKGKNG